MAYRHSLLVIDLLRKVRGYSLSLPMRQRKTTSGRARRYPGSSRANQFGPTMKAINSNMLGRMFGQRWRFQQGAQPGGGNGGIIGRRLGGRDKGLAQPNGPALTIHEIMQSREIAG